MPKVRAVLWDVDGTLSDSSALGFSSTMEVLRRNNLPAISTEDYHIGTRYTTPERFAWHATGNPKDAMGVSLGKQFDDLYVDLVSPVTSGFYPCMRDVLIQFRKQHGEDIQFGALSNACGAYVRAVLKANEVDSIFRVQLGADEVAKPKPFPNGLYACCDQLSLHPSQCVYIGDSPTDGQAARAAGMHGIGVSWGSHPVESLQKEFPIVVHSVAELKEKLQCFVAQSIDA
jgi:phosphoglycolate phosphatase-like HAD superfamily hydrolase